MKRYVNYLKDNSRDYWFRRKLYGWGWVPAKLEGWVVIFIFSLLVFLDGFIFLRNSSFINWIYFLIVLSVLVFLLILVCYGRGEKPRWSWGAKDNS